MTNKHISRVSKAHYRVCFANHLFFQYYQSALNSVTFAGLSQGSVCVVD